MHLGLVSSGTIFSFAIHFDWIIFVLFPVVRLRSNDTTKSTQAKFLVHTMQIIPHKFCKTFDTQKILPVSSENDTLHHFRVEVRMMKFEIFIHL